MSFSLTIQTLEGVAYQEEVERVTIPTKSGEITVLPHHAPLLSLLVPGELRVTKKNETKDTEKILIAVSAGFVEMRRNGELLILADTADGAEEIDLEESEAARKRAEEALERGDISEVDLARFQEIVDREMARTKVAHSYLERKGLR